MKNNAAPHSSWRANLNMNSTIVLFQMSKSINKSNVCPVKALALMFSIAVMDCVNFLMTAKDRHPKITIHKVGEDGDSKAYKSTNIK